MIRLNPPTLNIIVLYYLLDLFNKLLVTENREIWFRFYLYGLYVYRSI